MRKALVSLALGTVLGAVLACAATYTLQVRQEARQRENDRRLLAGALATELRSLLKWWTAVEATETTGLVLGLEETYFSVFDGAGSRLYLLPDDLAVETVDCYLKMKLFLDRMRSISLAFQVGFPSARDDESQLTRLLAETVSAQTDAIRDLRALSKDAGALAERLEAMATG